MKSTVLAISLYASALAGSSSVLAAPAALQTIQIQAWPNASCLIASVGNANDTPVPAAADSTGIVQFAAVPAGPGSAVKALSISCQDTSGRKGAYSLDLTSASAFAPLAVPSSPSSSLRPALTGDPMSYSRDELVTKGYGMRPDPLTTPDTYAVWLQAASQPGHVLTTIGQPMPVHAYGTLVSHLPPGWSGGMFEEGLSADYFQFASGSFVVPSATPTTSCSAASIWTGLGGWGAPDLIQTGIQLLGNSTVVNTFPFLEYWSGNGVGGNCYANDCYLGFNVSPGDSMLAEVWPSDGSCRTSNFSGGYGCFYLTDATSGWSSLSVLAQVNTFQGLTAEFIAEDNGPNNFCNSSGTYAEFGNVQNAAFSANDTVGHTHTWALDPNGYVRMLSANSSNQVLGFANINTRSDTLSLYWFQGN